MEGIVPQTEEGADFCLCDFCGTYDFLGHERGVMVRDHPLSIFECVYEGIAGFDFGSIVKCEFINSCDNRMKDEIMRIIIIDELLKQ